MTNLDVWYAHADVDQVQARVRCPAEGKRQRKLIDKGMAKARTRDSMQELAKLTRVVDGRPRIICRPAAAGPDRRPAARRYGPAAFDSADRGPDRQVPADAGDRPPVPARARSSSCDMARKVVGVGSVGTRCWIVLMLGRDESDPLFLQVKEAEASVLAASSGPASTPTRASGWSPASG